MKIYLLGIAALTGYITDYSTSFSTLLVTGLTVTIIGTTAILTWIGLGTLLRTVYQKYYRPTDIILALTLFEYIYSMLEWQTIKKLGESPMKDGTKCLRADYSPRNAEPRVVPIVQSTTYVYDSAREVVAVFDDPMKSLVRSRFGNPTVIAIEDRTAQLEGGIDAMHTASRQVTTLFSILNACDMSDNFVSTTEIHGDLINLFSFTLEKLGIKCIHIDKDASDEKIDKASQSNTKVMFGETIANLVLATLDTERLTRVAHRHDVPLIADNTFATSILCKPFEYDAGTVIHSTLEYMDDHTVQIGDYIIDSEGFNWTKGNFPGLTEPDEPYYGISYTKTYGKKAYIVKAKMQLVRDLSVYSAAYPAFLLNPGLETLTVRMKQYCENAMAVIRYLGRSPYAECVIYPRLENYESHPPVQKYLKGCSGVISFVIKGGRETTMRLVSALELASNEVHVADTHTCILHPMSETHRWLTDEQLTAAGIESGVIRLSVGLGNTEDIITDLDKAFSIIEY